MEFLFPTIPMSIFYDGGRNAESILTSKRREWMKENLRNNSWD